MLVFNFQLKIYCQHNSQQCQFYIRLFKIEQYDMHNMVNPSTIFSSVLKKWMIALTTTPQRCYGPFSGTTRVGRHSIWTNQCPPPPSSIFYRPDALPTTQPTVLKHWRHSLNLININNAAIAQAPYHMTYLKGLTLPTVLISMTPICSLCNLYDGTTIRI